MRTAALLLSTLALPLAAQSAGEPPEATLAIVDVTVIDGSAEVARPGQTVLLAGDEILLVGPAGTLEPPAGAVVLDGGGKYLLPGLVDMHVHLSFWDEPQVKGGAHVGTVTDPEAYGEVLPRYVGWGVTSVRDMGGSLEEIDSWRARLTQGEVPGPRVFRAGPFIDGPKPNDKYRTFVTSPEEARAAVAELAEAGVDFLEIHSQTPRDLLPVLAEEATARGLTLTGHVPYGATLEELSALGQRTIEHADALFVSRFGAADREIEDYENAVAWYHSGDGTRVFRTLKENDTYVTPTLVVYDVSAKSAPEPWNRLPELTKTLTKLMHRRGVPLLAGTDTARRTSAVVPGEALHRELELLVSAGLTPLEAIRAATSSPAAVLGVADEQGTVEAGKRADLLLLNADPLVDVANTRQIAAVLVRGRLYAGDELAGLRAAD